MDALPARLRLGIGEYRSAFSIGEGRGNVLGVDCRGLRSEARLRMYKRARAPTPSRSFATLYQREEFGGPA